MLIFLFTEHSPAPAPMCFYYRWVIIPRGRLQAPTTVFTNPRVAFTSVSRGVYKHHPAAFRAPAAAYTSLPPGFYKRPSRGVYKSTIPMRLPAPPPWRLFPPPPAQNLHLAPTALTSPLLAEFTNTPSGVYKRPDRKSTRLNSSH